MSTQWKDMDILLPRFIWAKSINFELLLAMISGWCRLTYSIWNTHKNNNQKASNNPYAECVTAAIWIVCTELFLFNVCVLVSLQVITV